MSEKKQCETCQNWDCTDVLQTFGICSRMGTEEAVFTVGPPDKDRRLITSCTFGCNLWEAKLLPPPAKYRPLDGPFWAVENTRAAGEWLVLHPHPDGSSRIVASELTEHHAVNLTDRLNAVCQEWNGPGWVSVKEGLPPLNETVLLCVPSKIGLEAFPAARVIGWATSEFGEIVWLKAGGGRTTPTHWSPLSPLPEG